LPEQRVGHISRGERAGVNLAMALAQNPELLILDEPTLGLDVVAKRAFLEAVLSSLEEGVTTIIYCSHQMDEIERLADNLIILERGELKHMSAPDEFCERVAHWVVELPGVPPEPGALPGVLQVQRIDGLFHYLVLDQDEEFGELLDARGALRRYRGEVNLDRAVNAFLARDHSRPS
jgi:ABC-2 type transport system ATP-binding protein